MFLPFFENLRRHGVPATLREFLAFLDGMAAGLATYDADGFYYLARLTLVKDERHLDKFDRAFAASFSGLDEISAQDVLNAVDIPDEWLRKMAEKHLSPEERAEIEALGGFEALMDTLKKRLENKKAATKGAASGSALRAPRLLVRMATTPKVCASGKTKAATNVRSKFGTSARFATSTTVSNWAPVISKSPSNG
jgi:uncharacterized protein with von Willebrand factor type A (vWA) domain